MHKCLNIDVPDWCLILLGSRISADTDMTKLRSRICMGPPLRGINLLSPIARIWQQRSGLTLAQAMFCCRKARSNFINQCWLIIIQLRTVSQRHLSHQSHSVALKLRNKMSFKSPIGQWVNEFHFMLVYHLIQFHITFGIPPYRPMMV